MTVLYNETIKESQMIDSEGVLQPWSKQGGKHNRLITRSEGIFFWDQEDNRYFDLSSQLVYANLGHKHPRMLAALNQLSEHEIVATGFASQAKSALTAGILKVAPKNMAKVYYTMAGAEANEHAIKIARMVTGKTKILSRYRSYHGSTYGAGNLTGEGRRFQLEPGVPGFIKFPTPYPYRDGLEHLDEKSYTEHHLKLLEDQLLYEGPETIAAVFIEPIPGSNGVLLPPKGYLKGVSDLCKRYHVLFVCDEVMTGFGRTGEWFAVDHDKVEPDMITFAKGVTAGYLPLGGVIVSEEVAAYFDQNVLMTGSTYSGHALSCAIGEAALTTYEEENILENVREVGVVLKESLAELSDLDYVGDVRSIGLFAAIELVSDKDKKTPILAYGDDYGRDPIGLMGSLLQLLAANGIHTYSHEACLFISPPLIITAQEVREAIQLLRKTLEEFAQLHPLAGKHS